MQTSGSFIILTNEKNKVLLVKRRDYPIWDLPGGCFNQNESAEQCAIRETKEETGLIISITKKIGEYHRPLYKDTQHIFYATIIGGEQIISGEECRKLKFFNCSTLPLLMVPNRKKQIRDYQKGKVESYEILNESQTLKNFIKLLDKLK